MFLRSNKQLASIGSDNGLAPNRRLVIIWANTYTVYWRVIKGQWFNEGSDDTCVCKDSEFENPRICKNFLT